MSQDDLTRWNRAGLRRFRYVDGNAVTYLERLRQLLQERLPAWTDLDVTAKIGQSEDERLQEQYHGKRRDFAWEITRTLARSAHVLTEHLDAYANEGYLRTATQWDSVRRLVEMLDYHPAPPASASSYLAIIAKSGKSGKVETGMQVKNAPDDGSAPLTFETLEDIVIDTSMNTLRCADWNRSQKIFSWKKISGSDIYQGDFPLVSIPEDISAGSYGVLVVTKSSGQEVGIAVTVSQIFGDRLRLKGSALPAGADKPKRSDIRLLLGPQVIQKPRLQGANIIEFEKVHSLTRNAMVAWQASGGWYAAKVIDVDNKRVSLSKSPPPAGVDVHTLLSSSRRSVDGSSVLMLPLAQDRQTPTVWQSNSEAVPSSSVKEQPIKDADGNTIAAYDYVSTQSINTAYYLSKDTPAAGKVITCDPERLVLDGDPGNLASGQWTILARSTGNWLGCRIAGLDQSDDSYTLQLDCSSSTAITVMYADFNHELRPTYYDRNLTPVWHASRTVAGSTVLPLETLPSGIERGRKLIVCGAQTSELVTVTSVDQKNAVIVVQPQLSAEASRSKTDDFTRYHTVIYGNVVLCGHGQIKPAKILGSGDATQNSQQFVIDVENVSFVADSTQPSGVSAALEVSVDGRAWEQVATLNDSEPTDHHYTVRMTRDGFVEISFGDGERGRRLPTGKSNVRAVYRVGSGAQGNLPKDSLTKVAKPHPLVDKVYHLLAASGGGDMESVASLRTSAPASVLALERAVSLSDFTHLASRHSSVWQARAFAVPTGLARHQSVDVVVVPAGGGSLTQTLRESLEAYLEAAALPGIEVQVRAYDPIYLNLDVTLRITASAYDPETVMKDVRTALEDALSLERAILGQPLYRSNLYEIIESVAGVENSVCTITEATVSGTGSSTPRRVARGSDLEIHAVFPSPSQILFVDEEGSTVTLAYEEFSL